MSDKENLENHKAAVEAPLRNKNPKLTFSQRRKKRIQKKAPSKKKNLYLNPSEDQLNTLLGFLQAESYRDAENLATLLTQQFPSHQFGWKVLGVVFQATGKINEALNVAYESERLAPLDTEAKFNLGKILDEMKRSEEAIIYYRKAIANHSNFPLAYLGLADTLKQLGRLEEAEQNYRQALKLSPENAIVHNNLGTVLKLLHRLEEAAVCYRRSIALKSDFAIAYLNLGITMQCLDKVEEAEVICRHAITLDPNLAEGYFNLGIALQELKKLEQAETCYRQAIAINNRYGAAYNNLGATLQSQGKFQDAITNYKQNLVLQPGDADAHKNLGTCLASLKQLDEAVISYERAQDLEPDLDYLLGQIIFAKLELCEWDGLSQNIEKLTRRINNSERASDPFLLHTLFNSPEIIKKGTEIFADHKVPKSTLLPVITPYQDHQRIRVGYFSPDFRNHPVTTLTGDLFKNHNRSNFEIHAFSLVQGTDDEWGRRVRAGVDYFHDVHMLSDRDIAIFSRSLELDIAVDLAGFTSNNRARIFAMAVAPVQVSYVGFLGTMGSSYYDYLIADKVMIPEETKNHFTENIVYLPCYQVNSSQNYSPDILVDKQYLSIPEDVVVFCCLNNTYKISPHTLDVWGRILERTGDSVLLLYAKSATAVKNLKEQIALRGINPKRLIFGGRLIGSQYWSRYKAVDLCLDTFLYNGGATSSDALRMGCPVLTCMGSSFSSRYGASLLTALDLPELITTTHAQYEELAVQLANDPSRLQALKEKLISHLPTSQLYDTHQFTRSLETAYTTMYKRSQGCEDLDNIYIDNLGGL